MAVQFFKLYRYRLAANGGLLIVLRQAVSARFPLLSNFNRAKFRHLLILESATLVTNTSCSKQCLSPLPKNGTQNAQNNFNFVTKKERSSLSVFRNSSYFYSAVISILNA